jgi:hypothetical protein
VEEVWADDSLLAWDGRVLEVFGFPGSGSARFHVANLAVEVDDPDRKGRRTVTLRPASRSGGVALQVPAEDWPAVEPLLDRVLAAMDAA